MPLQPIPHSVRYPHTRQLPYWAGALHPEPAARQDIWLWSGAQRNGGRSGGGRARRRSLWRRYGRSAWRRGRRRWFRTRRGRRRLRRDQQSSLQSDLERECPQSAEPREPGNSHREPQLTAVRTIEWLGGRTVFERGIQSQSRIAGFVQLLTIDGERHSAATEARKRRR